MPVVDFSKVVHHSAQPVHAVLGFSVLVEEFLEFEGIGKFDGCFDFFFSPLAIFEPFELDDQDFRQFEKLLFLRAIAMPFADTAVVIGDLVFDPVVGEEIAD